MSVEDNKKLVLRWRDEIWNKRNVDALDDLAAPDYVAHIAGFPGPVRGREAGKQMFAAWLASFEIRVTPELLIAEGDMVAVRDSNWAKSVGEFQGAPATGKEGTLTSTDLYRIVDGRVAEQWFEADYTGFMQQLGVHPALGPGSMAVPGGIMSAEDNKAIVTASFEAIFNQHQVDRAAGFYAPGYLDHAAAPGTAPGLEGAKQKWSAYIAALPDMRATILDLVAEGEKVAVAWTVEGTHRGVLLGIPATGRYLRLSGMAFYRLAEGKITEASEEFDKLNLMQQLGVLPASTAPAPATG